MANGNDDDLPTIEAYAADLISDGTYESEMQTIEDGDFEPNATRDGEKVRVLEVVIKYAYVEEEDAD